MKVVSGLISFIATLFLCGAAFAETESRAEKFCAELRSGEPGDGLKITECRTETGSKGVSLYIKYDLDIDPDSAAAGPFVTDKTNMTPEFKQEFCPGVFESEQLYSIESVSYVRGREFERVSVTRDDCAGYLK